MTDISKEIMDNQIVVFIIPNKEYADRLKEIVHAAIQVQKRICYVCLNKPCDTLIKNLEINEEDLKKFFFIDAITQSVKTPDEKDRVMYISSPRSLTELNVAISKVLEVGKIDCTIFDSLSTLLVYENAMTVTKFVHTIMAKLRTTTSKGIFTALKEDVTKNLMKDLNMFGDSIVDLSGSGDQIIPTENEKEKIEEEITKLEAKKAKL